MNSAELTPEERAHLIQLLHDSRARLLQLIGTLTDAQWTAAFTADGWSVQHVAEHIVRGEILMLEKIAEALAGPPNPEWEEQDARKTRFLERVLPDRARTAVAPRPLEPHSHWTREETIARFDQVRARTMQLAENLDQPVKDRTAEHPFPVFNRLNAYHWMLYIPLHNQRHNQQIAEIVERVAQ